MVWYWQKEINIRSMKQNSKLSSRLKQICQFIFFNKGEKAIQWRKNGFQYILLKKLDIHRQTNKEQTNKTFKPKSHTL